MKLRCVNLVSADPAALSRFYSLVLRAACTKIVPGRFEAAVGDHFVVITHTAAPTPVNPDSCGLEFEVEDVDAEYARLVAAGVKIPSPPVTYPWQWRAIGFRDPDGNAVELVQYVGE